MRFSGRLASIFATGAAAAGAIAAGPPETGFDRPGGVYSNVPAENAAACAIACARDNICMSWSFRVTDYVGCSLKAVVPARAADANATSGVADRAADFLSLVAIDPPKPEPAPAAAPPEPLQAASLTAAPTFSRPMVITLVRPVRLAQISAFPTVEEPARVDTPKSLSLAVAGIAPVAYRPPTGALAAPLSNAAPILAIETPAPLNPIAMINAPKPLRSAPVSASHLPALDMFLPLEAPQTLAAPAAVKGRAGVARIAARPLANAVASLSDARPITEIAVPAALDRARLTPPPAPLALPLSSTGLGAQVTLAVPPPSAAQANPSAAPANYAPDITATFEKAAVSAGDEEELLGAP